MRVTLTMCCVTLALALGASPAWAGQVETDVQQAQEAIRDGDFEAARQLLDQAEAHALTSTSVVLGRSLASIWYYRGVLEYYDGDRNKRTLDLWRLALLADIDYPFDTSLVADQEPQDLFGALRLEVSSRPHYDGGVDEAKSSTKVFVDGVLLNPYSLIVGGRHLVQVACSDGVLRNSWYDFGSPPDYYAMCEAGGSLTQNTDPGTPPDGQVDGGGDDGGEEPEKEPKPPREPREPRESDGKGLQRLTLGAGGALLVSGVAVNFLVVNPTYGKIEDARAAPATVTRDEADALTGRFNASRFTTMGLIGAGALTVGVGVMIDDHLWLVPAPNGVGLVGQF